MPAARRRKIRLSISLLLLVCGVLVSMRVDKGASEQRSITGTYSVLDAPTFTAEFGRGRLMLSGTTESAEHEAGLMQVAADQFGDYATETSFKAGVILADSWVTASTRLLYALAAMDSASAMMRDHSIEIRGITSDAPTYSARIEFLRDALPADALINEDIIVIDDAVSLNALCRRTFAYLIKKPVAFRQSSAEIRTSSYSILDNIIDFAYDCRNTTIAITGHSDASGDPVWNLQLSLARAQAVADYLVRGGIASRRMQIDGRGSSTPIADNDTAHGRSLNRRIEIELR